MGTNAVGAHGRRRAGRLREEPVPQVQHPLDRDHARRRFRHDARGDAAALLAAGQGARHAGAADAAGMPAADEADAIRPLPGLARRDPDRRRPGPDDGGARDPGGARHCRQRRRRSASPRASTATPAARRFFVAGQASRSRCRRAIPCSISSSACATRRTASPSARTGRGARRRWSRTRSTRSAASGPRRKRALLHAFRHRQGGQPRRDRGSDGVDGISEAIAKLVYNHFHDERELSGRRREFSAGHRVAAAVDRLALAF